MMLSLKSNHNKYLTIVIWSKTLRVVPVFSPGSCFWRLPMRLHDPLDTHPETPVPRAAHDVRKLTGEGVRGI